MTEAVMNEAPLPLLSTQPTSVEIRKERKQKAVNLVNLYALASVGTIVVPGPLVTQVLMSGVLAKLLSDLSVIYKVKLTDHKIKVLIAAVLGGAHSTWISFYIARYIDFVPGINIVAKGAVSSALIYFIGQLFIHHFESGAWR